jgi:hypothetical protein
MINKYQGPLPDGVSKNKFSIRMNRASNKWQVHCEYSTEDYEDSAQFENDEKVVSSVNKIKANFGPEGGSFYITEFKHIVVPAGKNPTEYYYAGWLQEDLIFEDKSLTFKPLNQHTGYALNPGDKWPWPSVGYKYRLNATGTDIWYKKPKKTFLSNESQDTDAALQTAKRFRKFMPQGGIFYVNYHWAAFTPPVNGSVYLGQIDPHLWFPEPKQD